MDTALSAGFEVLGFADDKLVKAPLPGFRVLCSLDRLKPLSLELDNISVVVAIGDNAIRKKVAEALQVTGVPFATIVHPFSSVSSFVSLGQGTIVMPGSVVNAGARVGDHVILNTCSSVDHDCIVEDFVHVSPGAHLAGNVTVKERCHVGTGV